MKRHKITLDERTFDVQVLDDPRRNQVRVEVDGESFIVGVESVPLAAEAIARETIPDAAPLSPPRPPRSSETSEVSGGNVVVAPLPGVIKSIVVRPGQQVAPNDELVVIEAMKMDNIIRATRAGAIGTIHVTEGRQVAYGEPLLEISNEQ